MVCYLDLDGFKPVVNDKYGHAAGDKLLIEIAHRMQKLVRANDTVGRLGGDEFVLLLTNLETTDEYRLVLNRLIEVINAPFAIDISTMVSVGVSIGVMLFPNVSDDPDILLRHADQAMYQAKNLGLNRICEYLGKSIGFAVSKKWDALRGIRFGIKVMLFRVNESMFRVGRIRLL